MQRNRKTENNESGNRILKSKYNDNKTYTKTNMQPSNKIMLTDLCPQQKAKIGQLIKTLEIRKKQNQDLTDQINSWKSNYVTLEKIKSQLESMIQTKNKQFKRLTQQIQSLNRQRIQKDIQLQEIHLQLKKQLKNKQKQSLKISIGISTIEYSIKQQQTQTKQKKKKQKSRQIQVNTLVQFGGIGQRDIRKNNFYQPNSKSFDRIMKAQKLISQHKNQNHKEYDTAMFGEDHNQNQNSNSKSKNSQPSRRQSSNIQVHKIKNSLRAEQLQDQRNWSQYGDQNKNQMIMRQQNERNIQVEDTENEDDEFQMLAKKWLELKQKNIQQMTQGYFNSENQPISNNKNLGIQSKLRPQSRKYQQRNDKNDNQIINQQQLNKALKSRDFSASRLLNSKSKKNISENSDKKSLQNSRSSYRNETSQINRKKSNLQMPQHKYPQSKISVGNNLKGNDFYSSDLLDLVEQINK